MANFLFELDDFEFDAEHQLAWDSSLAAKNDLDGYQSQPALQHGIDPKPNSSTFDDLVGGWLNQQVMGQEIASTNGLNNGEAPAFPMCSPPANATTMPAPLNSFSRNDSAGSLQSMASATSSNSRRGQRIAGGYLCGQCGRVFDVPSDLRHHERNHMAAASRPYACHCGQRFLYPKDLNRHMDRKHGSATAAVSLSRSQSMDDVHMPSHELPSAPVNRARAEMSLDDLPKASSTPSCKCRCTCKREDQLDAGQLREQSQRFCEAAIERMERKLEGLQNDLITLRKERYELAGAAIKVPLTVEDSHTTHTLEVLNTDDATSLISLEKLQHQVTLQNRQIDRLKLEVQFATQDAAFWLEECNHYSWLMRKIPKAPRPPIYAVPKQAGRVSLVQYAKGWLGAISTMFRSSDVEPQQADCALGLGERLADQLDRLSMQR